jgi:hypothetical protein
MSVSAGRLKSYLKLSSNRVISWTRLTLILSLFSRTSNINLTRFLAHNVLFKFSAWSSVDENHDEQKSTNLAGKSVRLLSRSF